MKHFSIHPDTTLGPVFLTVADLKISERFYRDALGFKTLQYDEEEVILTADEITPLLVLQHGEPTTPRPSRTTGLYHFAILVPTRRDLGRSLRRLIEMKCPLSGAADHLVSEALYLNDPDGNGIEIYRDRPRDTWQLRNGMVRMATDPLDFEGVMREAAGDNEPWAGLPIGAKIGHVHLQVHDIEAARAFYHDILGFDIVAAMPSALFISAGGYHHHIGLNTWTSQGAPPPPAKSTGLRHFVITLPDKADLDRVSERLRDAGISFEQTDAGIAVPDPSQNQALIRIS